MKLNHLKTFVALSALYGAAPTAPTMAQDNIGSTLLDEIVITAQKRNQNLNDVGVSVTAFNGNQLRQLGLTDTTQLAAFTPGMVYTENGGAPAPAIFSIRGISQSDFSDHQEGPNAVYTDGAYISFTGAAGLAMYDAERVEVLRGPQGTLFGRNATGGLIHVISKKPTDEFEAFLDLTVAEHNTFILEGAIGGALGESVNGRLSFMTNQSDGWFKNDGPGGKGIEERNYNIRAQLDFMLSDTTSLLLNVRTTQDDSASSGKTDAIRSYESETHGVINEESPNFNFGEFQLWCDDFFGAGLPGAGQDCFGEQLNPDPFAENTDTGIFDREYYGATATLTTDLSDSITLTAITDYQQMDKLYIEDADKTVLTTGTFDPFQASKQVSQEVYLSASEGAFRWQAGVYYLKINGDFDTTFGGDDAGFLSSSVYSVDTETYAVYGQTEWDISEKLTLITGLRYTKDTKTLNFSGTCTQVFDGPEAPCSDADFFNSPNPLQEILGYHEEIDDTDYAYKIELDWKPSTETLLYVSATRGNKGGGFSASVFLDAAPGEVDFAPEVLNAYEIGLKQTLFDGSAQLNASVYFYDYKNHQAQTFDGQAVVIQNVDAEVLGLDAELVVLLGQGWEALAGIGIMDTKAKDVPLDAGVFVDQELGLAPDLTANMIIRKSWDMQSGAEITAQLAASYVGDRFLSVVNEQVTSIDSYTRADARLTYRSPDDSWSASIFVDNIMNDLNNTYKFNESETNGTTSVSYDTPRVWGVQLSKQW